LRRIRRQKLRTFGWSAAVVCFTLTVLVGLLYFMQKTKP